MISKLKIGVYSWDSKEGFLDQLDFIVKEWYDYNTDCFLIVRCYSRLHEAELRKLIDSNDFNPYMYTHVNIRKQNTWVYEDKKGVTKKAISLLGMGIGVVSS